MKRSVFPSILLLTLVGCQQEKVPTAEENRQLNDVSNLLDEAPANLESIDDSRGP